MSDLADRLRSAPVLQLLEARLHARDLMKEAAGEIDRLRAQLARLVEAARWTGEAIRIEDWDWAKLHGERLRALVDEISGERP